MNEIKNVNVRVGDEVVVIAGTYKGKKGKVLSVNPADNTCVVKDVNIISKHKKMRKQGEKSEIKKWKAVSTFPMCKLFAANVVKRHVLATKLKMALSTALAKNAVTSWIRNT